MTRAGGMTEKEAIWERESGHSVEGSLMQLPWVLTVAIRHSVTLLPLPPLCYHSC